jgi:CheY-like chemotaxis protein
MGWDIRVAATIAEAKALLLPCPDGLVLDLMLPDGDGVDLLEQVRAEGLPIRIAVTTGSADVRRLQAVADLRPDVLLAKPIHLPDLLRALDIN